MAATRKRAPRPSAAPRLRILVTAGPTREYLDPVRYLSNDSSGQMGFAIAQAAARRRHAVTLVHGPVALKPPAGVTVCPVISADDMWQACRDAWPAHDVLIMAAAVADFAPARRVRDKLKKAEAEQTIGLKPTRDILATLARRRRPDQVVIGFALEDRDAEARAAAKLRAKRLDAIVLNAPTAIGAGASAIHVLSASDGWQSPRQGTKRTHATHLVKLAEQLHATK
jgi:phosphopantothenoylcysteine decarboxylase/phosphopantothenate--cysteine ligase